LARRIVTPAARFFFCSMSGADRHRSRHRQPAPWRSPLVSSPRRVFRATRFGASLKGAGAPKWEGAIDTGSLLDLPVLGDSKRGVPVAHRRRRSDAETSDFANVPELSDPILSELLALPLPGVPLRSLSRIDEFLGPELPYDRRLFSFGSEPENYSLGVSSKGSLSMSRVSFNDPSTVAICHRRQVRKEVMIAKRRRGRGGARRDWKSEIKC